MSSKERDRLRLIHEVEQGHLTGKEAARIHGISYRQFKRILKGYREEDDRALMHGLRNKESNRRIPAQVREKAATLIQENYPDFGPTLACEKLWERDGIKLSRETVRKIMVSEGLRKPRKKKERHRKKRERRPCFGELIQIDGSHHDWFEGRDSKAVLMVMVDDATGMTLAMFAPAEDTRAGMLALKMWLEKYGRPRAIYADRHSIWIAQRGDKGERDDIETTQLARILRELDIEFIPAGSPQAKGRVERSNGILQDRLVKEMRLEGISGIDDGNRFLRETFLPEYNRKFRKPPASGVNVHRKLGRDFNLRHILSVREGGGRDPPRRVAASYVQGARA